MVCAIREISIRDFKSITDTTLDLGRINVLIGENGAGKSNILEAIGVLSAAIGGSTGYMELKGRGVRLSSPEVFKTALRERRRTNRISLKCRFSHDLGYSLTLSPKHGDTGDALRYWTEAFSVGGRNVVSRSLRDMKIRDGHYAKPDDDIGAISAARAMSVLTGEHLEAIDVLRRYAIYAPSTQVLRGTAIDDSAQGPFGIHGGGLAAGLEHFLKGGRGETDVLFSAMRDLFPWIRSFGKIRPQGTFVSHHLHPGKQVVAFQDDRMTGTFDTLLAYDVSEGALYALFLLALVLHDGAPPFLAVDNLDSTLNPRLGDALFSRIIDIVRRHGRKMIIVSLHNPALLNAVDIFDDDIRLLAVERDRNDGSTTVRRINPGSHMDREKWLELTRGNPLSTLWMDGVLGALPEIALK